LTEKIGGFQWFPLRRDFTNVEMVHKALGYTTTQLQNFIYYQSHAKGILSHRIFLVGFSQGAIMALAVGLRWPEELGGIVAFAGMVSDSPDTLRHVVSVPQKVLLLHHWDDPVVPFATVAVDEKLLHSRAMTVKTLTGEGGHWISLEDIAAAEDFLLSRQMFQPK
jgi:phospholipase/carboxylesterase